jgi:hypothetical protein
MQLKDFKKLKKEAIVHINAKIVKTKKQFKKDGTLFYTAILQDNTAEIEICICEDYFYKNSIQNVKTFFCVNAQYITLRCHYNTKQTKLYYYIEQFNLSPTPILFNLLVEKKDGIDYKDSIKDLTPFQILAKEKNLQEINIVNIPYEKLSIYQTIFEHIAHNNKLVYKAGSLFGFKKKNTELRIKNNRKILFDFEHTVNGCMGTKNEKLEKEQDVALLVLQERKELFFN